MTEFEEKVFLKAMECFRTHMEEEERKGNIKKESICPCWEEMEEMGCFEVEREILERKEKEDA